MRIIHLPWAGVLLYPLEKLFGAMKSLSFNKRF